MRDALTMTWRNLLRLTRNPELIVFSTVQPIIFVLMFVYVFGGAIKIPGGVPYVDFLMAGVWVQSVTFGALNTGVGLAEDLQAGLIERFRSLPMARSAVLVGRTTADLVRNVFVVTVMTAVGFLVGFELPHDVLSHWSARLAGRAALLVRVVVGVGIARADGTERRDCTGGVLPDHRRARVRVGRVRAGRDDAGLAPGVRGSPAGVGRSSTRCGRCTLGGPTGGKVFSALLWIGSDRRGVRAALDPSLSQGDLAPPYAPGHDDDRPGNP